MADREPSAYRATITNTENLYGIWTPLFDTPINVRISREQLQALQDGLRGISIMPGWKEYFDNEIEGILRLSIAEPIPTEPDNTNPTITITEQENN